MPKILVDLSHNEDYSKIPQNIFDLDFIFDFVNYADKFPEFDELRRHYNLIIMGNIIPAENHKDHLFNQDEIITIIKYVEAGGSLLLTTSSGGDFNYGRDKHSIRNLSKITGVRKYWWGEIFSNKKNRYTNTTEDLIFKKFDKHPIFNDINKILLSDSTFLKASENIPNLFHFNTDDDIYYRDFNDYEEIEIESSPIIVINENAGRGRVITISSTFFMTNHPQYGVEVFDNKKFFKNIISWLLHQI